ncbi:MAG TPA: prepilin peptidase [Rhizomicrobium sp.]|nr:prepilin peptidase [Rhizomicrobium sp.]
MSALDIVVLAVAVLFGLVIGSFLSVLVTRLPEGEPIAMARSRCPRCGRTLSPAELIPLLSWLVQRGRCRACGGGISLFYPAMEVAAALVAVAAIVLFPWPALVAICLVGWALLGLGAWAVRRLVLGHRPD